MYPKQAIELIENQIKKGNELLEGNFSEGQYGAWENSTKHILMRIFGSDSHHIDDIMLCNRAGATARNEVEALMMRTERLLEQIELLQSPKEQLLIDLTLEEALPSGSNAKSVSTKTKEKDNYNPTITINTKKLKELMKIDFSLDELGELCDNLKVEKETFRTDTRPHMTEDMVEYYKRRNETHRLFIEALVVRPNSKNEFLACLE